MSRLITPEAILSYPNLISPRPLSPDEVAAGKNPKYGCALVFPSGTDISALKKACLEVAKAKWGDQLDGAKLKVLDTANGPVNYLVAGPLRVRLPWRDHPDDVASKGYPEGSVFFNANTTRRPQIVTQIPDPETGKPTPLTDESKVRPGAIVRASLDPYAYSASGNKGVTFGLGNLQWLRDGDASVIGATAGPPAVDEFDADASAVADLGDLTGEDDADDSDDLSDLLG